MKLTAHLLLVPTSRIRGAIPPLPQYVFMAWYLVKHRDNFTFTFTFTRLLLPWSNWTAYHSLTLTDVKSVCAARTNGLLAVVGTFQGVKGQITCNLRGYGSSSSVRRKQTDSDREWSAEGVYLDVRAGSDREGGKIIEWKASLCIVTLHGLGPVSCSDSKLTSEYVNLFRRFSRTPWMGDRKTSTYTEQHNTEKCGPMSMPRLGLALTIVISKTILHIIRIIKSWRFAESDHGENKNISLSVKEWICNTKTKIMNIRLSRYA